MSSSESGKPITLGPLKGPLHHFADQAMGAAPLSPASRGAAVMPGVLRPRTLSPIQQHLLPPAHATTTSLNLPPPLPLPVDKGKGPAGGKPYKKKGTSSSSDENITSDEGGASSKPVVPRMPSLSPIGSPPPQFPVKRPLPRIQSQPSRSFTSQSAVQAKISLPSMPSRKTSVDPFSMSNASADSSTSLEPIRKQGPPVPLTFHRPTPQPMFSKPAALPPIVPSTKDKTKMGESGKKEEESKQEKVSKQEEENQPDQMSKSVEESRPEETSKPDNPA